MATRRYSVVSGVASGYTETQTDYFVTGNVAKTRDALSREVAISYDDSFATYADDASNTETVYNATTKTYAYPTTVTDPATYSSQVKYWYHTGAVTKTTDPKGGIGIKIYELLHGRLQKAKNANIGAFTEYAYGTSHLYVQTWTTIMDGSDTNSANRFYSLTLTDGAGRLRAVVKDFVKDHANSIFANNSTYHIYDIMGRLVQQSRPTEVNASWVPTGDDAGGYVWQQQAYDWKGRPTTATNFDGTTTQIQYTGCGCAGGEIVTTIDEVGRTQKSYADTFGRAWKSEIYNGAAVYATTTSTFNVRDQATQITELENATSKTQITTMTYDGYGRLATRQLPKESAVTNYSYFANDQINTVTDARGASATYTYNTRNLPTNISYSAPSGVAYTNPVSFTYNELGQRLTMTDGLGSVNYNYNATGQYLNSEVRNIIGVGSYTLSYQYNLGGQLKSITDPFNNQINYTFDKAGQQATVTGSAFAGTTQYVNSAKYRTWGAIKEMNFANGNTATLQYNNRMQPTQFLIPNVIGANYFYTASGSANDGRLKRMEGLVGSQVASSYQYDHAGRKTSGWADYATAPLSITSQPPVQNQTLPAGFQLQPYQQGYDHDAFGNMSFRGDVYWHFFPSSAYEFFYTEFENGRAMLDGVPGKVHYPNQDRYWVYDNAGNVTNDSFQTITFDAEGRTVYSQAIGSSGYNSTFGLDGDGQLITSQSVTSYTDTKYLIRSSVMSGQIITQVNTVSGQSLYETNVYINGVKMATQTKMPSGYPDSVSFEHRDPHNTLQGNRMLDPLGTQVEKGADMQWTVIKDKYWNLQNSYSNLAALQSNTQGTGSSPANTSGGCYMDNVPMPCDIAYKLRGSGEMFGETNQVTAQYSRKNKQFEQYKIFASGYGGWMPISARQGNTKGSWYDPISGTEGRLAEQKEVPFPDKKGILTQILAQGDCAKLVSTLIDTVASITGRRAYSNDVLKVLEKVETQQGVKFEQAYFPNEDGTKSPVDALAEGSIGGDSAGITISPKRYTPATYHKSAKMNAKVDNASMYNIQTSYGTTLLHELIHHAGLDTYTDYELAKALHTMGKIKKAEFDRLNPNPNNPIGSSIAYDMALTKECFRVAINPYESR